MNFFLSLFLQCFAWIIGIVIVFQILGKFFIKDIQEDFNE